MIGLILSGALAADFSGVARPQTGLTVTATGESKTATLAFEHYGESETLIRAGISAPLDEKTGRAALVDGDWRGQNVVPGVSGYLEFGGTSRTNLQFCSDLKLSRDLCLAIEAELDRIDRFRPDDEQVKKAESALETAQKDYQEAASAHAQMVQDADRWLLVRDELATVASVLDEIGSALESDPPADELAQLESERQELSQSVENLEAAKKEIEERFGEAGLPVPGGLPIGDRSQVDLLEFRLGELITSLLSTRETAQSAVDQAGVSLAKLGEVPPPTDYQLSDSEKELLAFFASTHAVANGFSYGIQVPASAPKLCGELGITGTCDFASLASVVNKRRYRVGVPKGFELTFRLGANWADFEGRKDSVTAEKERFKSGGVYVEPKVRASTGDDAFEFAFRYSLDRGFDPTEFDRCVVQAGSDDSVRGEVCKNEKLVTKSVGTTNGVRGAVRYSRLSKKTFPGKFGSKDASALTNKDSLRFGVEVTVSAEAAFVARDGESTSTAFADLQVLPFVVPATKSAKANAGVGAVLRTALMNDPSGKNQYKQYDMLLQPFIFIGGVLDPRMK